MLRGLSDPAACAPFSSGELILADCDADQAASRIAERVEYSRWPIVPLVCVRRTGDRSFLVTRRARDAVVVRVRMHELSEDSSIVQLEGTSDTPLMPDAFLILGQTLSLFLLLAPFTTPHTLMPVLLGVMARAKIFFWARHHQDCRDWVRAALLLPRERGSSLRVAGRGFIEPARDGTSPYRGSETPLPVVPALWGTVRRHTRKPVPIGTLVSHALFLTPACIGLATVGVLLLSVAVLVLPATVRTIVFVIAEVVAWTWVARMALAVQQRAQRRA